MDSIFGAGALDQDWFQTAQSGGVAAGVLANVLFQAFSSPLAGLAKRFGFLVGASEIATAKVAQAFDAFFERSDRIVVGGHQAFALWAQHEAVRLRPSRNVSEEIDSE